MMSHRGDVGTPLTPDDASFWGLLSLGLGALVAGVRAIQKLSDHIKSCDQRYLAMEKVNDQRHKENLEALREIRDGIANLQTPRWGH